MPRSEYEVQVGLTLLSLIEDLDPEDDFNTHLTANLLLVKAQRQVDENFRQSEDARLNAERTPATV